MTNIVIKKKPRITNGKKISGGRGKEVDIVSTDGSRFFWVEVTVSARPYPPLKAEKLDKCVSDAEKKFAEEKEVGQMDTYMNTKIRHPSGVFLPISKSYSQ